MPPPKTAAEVRLVITSKSARLTLVRRNREEEEEVFVGRVPKKLADEVVQVAFDDIFDLLNYTIHAIEQ